MRHTSTLTASVIGVLALAACSSNSGPVTNSAAGDSSTINVGVIPTGDLATIYIAQHRGYFADAGLKVKTKTLQNASSVVPAVMNGQLQIGTTANVPFLVAKSKNLPIKALANSADTSGKNATDYSGLFVKKGSSIDRPRDLEGKKVATNNLNNVLELAVDEAVRKDGGDPSRVRFVPIPFPDMATALKKGQVDAISVVEPWYTTAASNDGTLLDNIYTTAYPANTSLAIYFSSTKWLSAHPHQAKQFRSAINKAGEYAVSHPEAVRKVMVNDLHMKTDLASKVRLPKFGNTLDVSSLETVAKLMVAQGFIQKAPAKGDLVWQP